MSFDLGSFVKCKNKLACIQDEGSLDVGIFSLSGAPKEQLFSSQDILEVHALKMKTRRNTAPKSPSQCNVVILTDDNVNFSTRRSRLERKKLVGIGSHPGETTYGEKNPLELGICKSSYGAIQNDICSRRDGRR